MRSGWTGAPAWIARGCVRCRVGRRSGMQVVWQLCRSVARQCGRAPVRMCACVCVFTVEYWPATTLTDAQPNVPTLQPTRAAVTIKRGHISCTTHLCITGIWSSPRTHTHMPCLGSVRIDASVLRDIGVVRRAHGQRRLSNAMTTKSGPHTIHAVYSGATPSPGQKDDDRGAPIPSPTRADARTNVLHSPWKSHRRRTPRTRTAHVHTHVPR